MATRLSWSPSFYLSAGIGQGLQADLYVDLLFNGRTLYPLRSYKCSSINTSLDIVNYQTWDVHDLAQAALDEILEEGIFIDVTLDEMIEFLDDMIKRGVRL